MADVTTVDEGIELPEKRKLDLPNSINKIQEEDMDKADSNKKQKMETPSENNGSEEHLPESEEIQNVNAAAEDEDDGEDDDEEDYNAEQEEDGDEEAEVVDRKGKGIMKDDKGKGKMLEESEDDDSDGDDSSDDSDSDFSDGLDDSDVEDDPLAEVDLDNILPSRTRQRRAQPGLRISSDPAKGNDAPVFVIQPVIVISRANDILAAALKNLDLAQLPFGVNSARVAASGDLSRSYSAKKCVEIFPDMEVLVTILSFCGLESVLTFYLVSISPTLFDTVTIKATTEGGAPLEDSNISSKGNDEFHDVSSSSLFNGQNLQFRVLYCRSTEDSTLEQFAQRSNKFRILIP
ncbi:hypothetical protein BUALT_Bualt01G0159700 [Buddleja alternifolia]|uniref:Uncharacterized protein n=1 Tax=Buddleja alternifolia TaxID=168488 RepID=A0AAV6Y9W8_9LAMI|nr:hypothetical protein BUALT_Bualt01G0159700 [Buddleja alternifolia]